MFEWDDVKYFLAVARHGSTLAAAKALKLSQSTVQRRIGELERKLGRELVKRHATDVQHKGLLSGVDLPCRRCAA